MFSPHIDQLTIRYADVAQHGALIEFVRRSRFRLIQFGLSTLSLPLDQYHISVAWHGERPVAILLATPAANQTAWVRACALDGISIAYHAELIGLLASTLIYHAPCTALWYSSDRYDSWLSDILRGVGFVAHNTIIALETNHYQALPHATPATLAPLGLAEYADIQRIDAQAFDPEWQKTSHDVRELTSGDGLSLIGVVDNVPVAYAIANWHDSHTTFHLVRIAVLPAYQGRRIASQLLNAVLEHGFVQGAARVTLNTQRNNYAALALYTRAGFTATGEHYEVIRAPCHGVSE